MNEKNIRVNEPVILNEEETEEERLNRERHKKGQARLKMIAELRPRKVAELRAELFDRKVPEEYADIISEFPGFIASNGYSPLESGRLFYGDEKNGDLLREKIKGATVMDLGCGQWTHTREAITRFHPARYIGVEKAQVVCPSYQGNNEGAETFYIDQVDMLELVSQLKDEAVGVYFMSAIEIVENNDRTRAYLDKLATEISRTLPVGGIAIFAHDTDHAFDDNSEEKYGMKRFGSRYPISIFIKEKNIE